VSGSAKSIMRAGLLKWMTVGVAAWITVPCAWSQGTFMFTNSNRSRTVPFTGCDGKPIAGAAYLVDVLVRNPKTGELDPGVEVLQSDAKWKRLTPVPMLEGATAGLFAGGTVRVPSVPPGQEAQLTIRVWQVASGADFASAKVRGETNITVKLGGIGNPPSFPSRLTGLRGLKVCEAK
jgi:hypothetical protein